MKGPPKAECSGCGSYLYIDYKKNKTKYTGYGSCFLINETQSWQKQ